MMKAIAELEARGPSSALQPAGAAAIERRPITVLSFRFEASSLPAQFDVEDWRDLCGGCVNEALAVVQKFGGRGQPELGDRSRGCSLPKIVGRMTSKARLTRSICIGSGAWPRAGIEPTQGL